jgi:hypothetical protein
MENEPRDESKLGTLEKIALGAGSALLSAGMIGACYALTHLGADSLLWGIPGPFIAAGIDYAVQKNMGNETSLASKRYAKALGIAGIGSGVSYAGIVAGIYIFFKYYFTLNFSPF